MMRNYLKVLIFGENNLRFKMMDSNSKPCHENQDEKYQYVDCIASIVCCSEYRNGPITEEEFISGWSKSSDVLDLITHPEAKWPFTEEEYFNQNEIIDGIESLGLDPEKFMYAILWLKFVAEDKFNRCIILPETSIEQAKTLLKYLESGKSFTIKQENGRKMEIQNYDVLEIIREALKTAIPSLTVSYSLNFKSFTDRSNNFGSQTEKIVWEAKLLFEFFKTKIDSSDKKRPVKLVCTILNFIEGRTDLDTDTLKGFMRSYPNPGERYEGSFSI